jgi:TolB-like protein
VGSTIGVGRTPSGPPAKSEIIEALRLVLRSDGFAASERKRALLTYIVDETLAGRGARLKGYTIALAVFGRDESFDAGTDPVVRVEVGRLRQTLERYYLTEGRDARVGISIPKGHYAAEFSYAESEREAAGTPEGEISDEHRPEVARARLWQMAAGIAAVIGIGAAALPLALQFLPQSPHGELESLPVVTPVLGPTVLVQEFSNAQTADTALAAIIAEEVTLALSRFKSIQVLSNKDLSLASKAQDQGAAPPVKRYDYVLRGTLREQDSKLRVAVHLEETRNGSRIWSAVSESAMTPASDSTAPTDVANLVARTLGNPFDVLFSHERKRAQDADRRNSPYGCVLRFYEYWETLDRDEHRALRDCHEAIIGTVPRYADAWVNLAWLYMDEYRYRYNMCDCGDPLNRAADAARRAIALEPDNGRAHLALAVVYWFRLDFRSFTEQAELALRLNEHDVLIATEVGLRFGIRGQWDLALPLLDRSIGRAPFKPHFYRVIYTLYHFETGNYELALEELRRTGVTDHPNARLLETAILGACGRAVEAQAAWRMVTIHFPEIAKDPRAWLLSRGYSDAVVAKFLRAFQAAGIAAS